MFFFKKLVASFLMPLQLGLLISFGGLYLLWFTKKQKIGRILCTSGILWIFIFSMHPVANLLLSPLENDFMKYEQGQQTVKYVVVLGGWHVSDPKLPSSSQISSDSLTRLIEGVTIFRGNPGSKLILSGYEGSDSVPNAVVMANIAQSIGVEASSIIIEKRPKDTKDEARLISDIVKDDPFVLVTSASHMKRAVALFKFYGLTPIPAPTYFLVKKSDGVSLKPSSYGLRKSEAAFHEYMGIAWANLMGQT
jgi:uncharacterized SAM-binding protein YcdF (DUF218 family)